jgi:hypothetical protein
MRLLMITLLMVEVLLDWRALLPARAEVAVTGRDQVQTALACLGLDTADPEPPAGRLRCASSATQHGEVPNREMLLRHRAIPLQVQKRVGFVLGEDAMTFTIHASKNGQSVVTVRISASTRRACWKAWAGKFTLPIQLGTGSPLRSSIGFHRLLAKRPNRG